MKGCTLLIFKTHLSYNINKDDNNSLLLEIGFVILSDTAENICGVSVGFRLSSNSISCDRSRDTAVTSRVT